MFDFRNCFTKKKKNIVKFNDTTNEIIGVVKSTVDLSKSSRDMAKALEDFKSFLG